MIPAASEAAPRNRAAAISPEAMRVGQIRHDDAHEPVDQDLHGKRHDAPDEAIDDGLGVHDGAGERQGEADEAEAESGRGRDHVVADQRELVVHGRKRVDREIEPDQREREHEEDRGSRASPREMKP